MMEPAMPVEESKRSESSQENKSDPDWWYQSSDMGEFKPERWLKMNEKGEYEYDPRAMPMQAFGRGIRGCFGKSITTRQFLMLVWAKKHPCVGKKLAYLEMRIIYAMSLWNLELRPISPALSDNKATDILSHSPQAVRSRCKMHLVAMSCAPDEPCNKWEHKPTSPLRLETAFDITDFSLVARPAVKQSTCTQMIDLSNATVTANIEESDID
nr:hypothetical protein CFP56_54355 [Quercus suber]